MTNDVDDTTMTTAMPPLIVAQQILWIRRHVCTTPMHVIKLVYLSHGWMLGIHGVPLLDEQVEAWQYGPVVPSTYYRYKRFGGEPITDAPRERSTEISSDQASLIKEVDDAYKEFSALDLSGITHKKGSPWYVTFRQHGLYSVIPNELIKRYYAKLAKRA